MRLPSLTRGGLAIVSAAVILLAGCSGVEQDPAPDARTSDPGEQTSDAPDEASSSAPPESAPATETQDDVATDSPDAAATSEGGGQQVVVASDGTFTFELPDGWVDAGSQVPDGMAAARASERTGDFFTNVVVTSQEPVGNVPESVEQAAKDIVGEDGEYEMLEATEIDGDSAYPFVLRRDQDGLALAQTQYWVEHGGTLYLVTISSAASEKEAADQAGQQVLESWSWQQSPVKPEAQDGSSTQSADDSPLDSNGCYWEITAGGSNGKDITANDFIDAGKPTVVLENGQEFQSDGCGTWKQDG